MARRGSRGLALVVIVASALVTGADGGPIAHTYRPLTAAAQIDNPSPPATSSEAAQPVDASPEAVPLSPNVLLAAPPVDIASKAATEAADPHAASAAKSNDDGLAVAAESPRGQIAAIGTLNHIQGTVTQASNGAAVSGVKVVAYYGGSTSCCFEAKEVTTSSLGSYDLPVSPGIYRVLFAATAGLASAWATGATSFAAAGDIDASPGNVIGVDAALAVGTAITGRVSAAADGSAVSGARLLAYTVGPLCDLVTITDSASTTGTFGLNLTSGSYKFRARAPAVNPLNLVGQWYGGADTCGAATTVVASSTTVANLALATGHFITGTVKTSGGTGIPSAPVYLYRGGGATCCTFITSAMTDGTGAYRILVADGSYKLHFVAPSPNTAKYLDTWYAAKPDFFAATSVVVAGLDVPGTDDVLVVGFAISGSVTNAAIAGISGASVLVYRGGSGAVCCSFVTATGTDATGAFTALVAPGTYRLQFRPPSPNPIKYIGQWWTGAASFGAATDITVVASDQPGKSATLATGFAISGMIKNSAGAGIANVSIYGYLGGTALCCTFVQYAKTDSTGAYQIIVASGTYRLRLWPGSGSLYLAVWFPNAARFEDATDIVVSNADLSGKDATLASGFRITGRATDAMTGAGLSNVSVGAYRGGTAQCCSFVSHTSTDSTGVYELIVANGTYRVQFYPFGAAAYLPQWWSGANRFDLGTDIVVNGGDVTGINPALATGSRISGTVTAAGVPVSNVWVNAFVGGPGAVCCTHISGGATDASGHYSFVVGDGPVRLHFYPGGSSSTAIAQWWSVASRFDLATDIVVSHADIALATVVLAVGYPITGTIRDGAGAPIAQAYVALFNAAGSCCTWVGSAGADATGGFRIVVQNGTYRAHFGTRTGTNVPQWWNNASRFDVATDIVVNGAAVTSINPTLLAGNLISGTVTSVAGAPLTNVSINAVDASPGAVCCTWVGGTTSSASGTFSLRVVNGTYRIFFYPRASSYLHQWWNKASRFELAANVVVNGADVPGIDAQLVPGVVVSGTITGAGGAPLDHAQVSATLGGGTACCTWVGGAQTNALGQYQLIAPQNSTIRLRIGAASYVPEWWDHKARFDLATDIAVGTTPISGKDAQLTPGFSVMGTVKNAAGAGIPNARVSVAAAGPGTTCCAWIAGTLTKADGTYEVVLGNGPYRMRFDATGSGYVAQWFSGASLFTGASDVTVQSANLVGIDLTLLAGFHIRGRLTNSAGTAASGVSVNAYQGGAAGCCTWVAGTTTDANGDYDLVVAAGTYRLWFFPRSGPLLDQWFSGAASFGAAADVTVGPDQLGKDGTLGP